MRLTLAVDTPVGDLESGRSYERSVAILHAGRVHIHVQQQAERVDEDVALAPKDLLARVQAMWVKRVPPFTAPLALYASMIAIVGLASRPAFSRHFI